MDTGQPARWPRVSPRRLGSPKALEIEAAASPSAGPAAAARSDSPRNRADYFQHCFASFPNVLLSHAGLNALLSRASADVLPLNLGPPARTQARTS
ncbi:uncharacterized protein PAN0_012c4463 [Moesziomyces antarcticus]|uniref:Uncharacterized protein n=2 Tax=Pseudozyma antarctica TaxID=84753 RepID=A0A5C3FYJ8_PSEA2|nr:uncharacterized protein PAN0_012c4463 [Moesziomyces antarcticus]GAK66241.1 hypothetical protein PAN0_012c4463 [Moesziomyces antarcticus]SPO48567.1 uncharacterized protein PSANT_06258 [Moesziomyces antarcticus]